MKNAAIIFMVLASLSISCDTASNEGIVIDVNIGLTIEDQEGNDLLNPATENSIQQDDVKVFYEIEGKKETYLSLHKNNDVILDNPAGFSIYPHDDLGKFQLSIFSNPTKGEAITIVELEGHEDITLKAEVSKDNGNTVVRKIWYKNNLAWPTEDNDGPAYVKVILE